MVWSINRAGPNAPRFDLTIVEILRDGSDGRRYNYFYCFLTSYSLAPLRADSRDAIVEQVEIMPSRLVIE